MQTLDEIKRTICQLPRFERDQLVYWACDLLPMVREPPAAYTAAIRRFLSVEEYLALEEKSPVKHEYVAGEIFAMSGVSRRHSLITTNLGIEIGNHLRGGPCEVHMEAFKLRLRVDAADAFYYPDVMVACGRDGVEDYYLRNPKLVIEVLSPSTELTDRREKALSYRQIGTLEEYAFVAQSHPEVTLQRRRDAWRPVVLTTLESVAEFRSVGLSVALARIYADALSP
ncbi:MAG: Uma2 family endonuclease [Steroidobacteraceae bacterium]